MTSTHKEHENTETEKIESFYQHETFLNEFTAEQAESYKTSLLLFQEYLQKGNSQMTHDAFIKLLDYPNRTVFQSIDDCHRHLEHMNLICHLTLMNTNVHPAPVCKLYFSLQDKIASLTNPNAAINLANDICHKYCLLVKNYSFSNYSKNIRSVINYINLHLDEELTLAKLAKLTNRNASALSTAFSKEVGMNITGYIHQTRIDKAVFYFNTTKMSVSEVSLAVGIQDFAYFSKLFRKQIGCSPREYAKQMAQT